jgi:hypothetical protein
MYQPSPGEKAPTRTPNTTRENPLKKPHLSWKINGLNPVRTLRRLKEAPITRRPLSPRVFPTRTLEVLTTSRNAHPVLSETLTSTTEYTNVEPITGLRL